MEPGIWLHPHEEDHYEHIDVYADDLLIACEDPQSVTDVLTNKHAFKIKGTGHISYDLGCDVGRDDDGTLNFAPKSVQRQ